MTPPNPSGAAPLTNKLILLVLSGIFVCMVLLVVRAFDRQPAVASNVEVSVVSAPGIEPGPESVLPITLRNSPRLPMSSTTRTQVTVVLPQPPSPRPMPRVGAVEELPEPGSETIGLAPGSGQHGNASRARISLVQPVGDPGASSPSVTGSITLAGNPPPEIDIAFGPSCGKFSPPATTRHYVIGPGGGLANVFVYVEDATPAPVTGPGPLLDQVGCMYEPYVLGVGVNQPFGIRNSDPEMHNVHATPRSPANKGFNFAQMAGAPVMLRSFATPEVLIRLKCDVHPWMFAYVGVVEHPWFAVSDINGAYQLPQGLPPGRYKLSAVHLKAGVQTKDIVVKQGQPVVASFQFGVPGKLSPQTTQTSP